jgi:hypothetical protein
VSVFFGEIYVCAVVLIDAMVLTTSLYVLLPYGGSMGQRISYEQKDGDSHEPMLQGDFWQIVGDTLIEIMTPVFMGE